jgi:hypothetical protein
MATPGVTADQVPPGQQGQQERPLLQSVRVQRPLGRRELPASQVRQAVPMPEWVPQPIEGPRPMRLSVSTALERTADTLPGARFQGSTLMLEVYVVPPIQVKVAALPVTRRRSLLFVTAVRQPHTSLPLWVTPRFFTVMLRLMGSTTFGLNRAVDAAVGQDVAKTAEPDFPAAAAVQAVTVGPAALWSSESRR